MNAHRRWILLLVVPLLFATQVFAQGLPTGTLAGRVTETEGLSLPGVTVSVKSPALQGTRTAVTNVNGDYVIPNLPPGDYVVTFIMSGFQSTTRNIKVSSGQQNPLNAKLSVSAIAAETMVVASSESVSQTAQGAATYSFETMNKLPVARTIAGSVVLSPGVNVNGPNAAIAIGGAASFDNVFTVNGVNIQDNIRGTPTNNLVIEDAIQETTTMTSGVSAEYGRFTGGVINAVTKQGGNTFSGSFRVTLNNDNWNAQPPAPFNTVNYTDKVVPTYEATLGGPFWKDRIWFFGAYRYVKNEYSGQTAAPTNESFPRADTTERYEAKLTISPFMNHTLTGSYTNGKTDQSGYYFTTFPILDTDVTYTRSLPSDLTAINYNGVLSANVFVEAQYSKKFMKFQGSGGSNMDLVGGTAVVVQGQGNGQYYAPIFCAVCPGAGDERDNESYLAKGTWFLSTKSLGSHNVAFGYEHFASKRTSNNWQSGSSWLFWPTDIQYSGGTLYPVTDSSSYMVFAPIPQVSQGSDIKTDSVFVNDTWRLSDKLSFNLGVRYDKNNATDAGGTKTADDSAFSPRLSASWDVRGDGKLRLSASYARYVGQVQENFAGSGGTSAGSPASYYYYWYGPQFNSNPAGPFTSTADVIRQMFAAWGVTSTNQFPTRATPDKSIVPGVNLGFRGTISSPHTDEYVLGFGGAFGRSFTYRVDAVNRKFKDFYAIKADTTTGTVFDSLGNEYDFGYFVNSNEPTREYTGLHTAMAWKSGAFYAAANWTWSHTIGNFIGENTGSGPVAAGSVNTEGYFLYYPEYFDTKWNSPKGSLAQDQRHRVRILASYDFKVGILGITPGLVQSIDTGTPYGARATVTTTPYVTNPGYVTPPSVVNYYFTARDAYRTDTIYRTDFGFNLSANIGPVEIWVQPQVQNLFNGEGVLAPNTSASAGTGTTPNSAGLVRFNPFTTTPIECPQTGTKAECIAMGANWKKGTNFGKPTTGPSSAVSLSGSFQTTRRWLVTMGVRF